MVNLEKPRRCWQCCFFDRARLFPKPDDKSPQGCCIRFAPRPLVEVVQAGRAYSTQDELRIWWPEVDGLMAACGSFEAEEQLTKGN